jgi:uncharacterized membrane protein SirB2
MDIAHWYPPLKTAHIALATASVGLFVVRALAVQFGAGWPLRPALRGASVLIDVALLSAGASLWAMLGLRPDRDPWLLAKLILIVAYIGCGSLALKRARTAWGRRVALAAALLCIAAVVAIARAHDPLAPLRGWAA